MINNNVTSENKHLEKIYCKPPSNNPPAMIKFLFGSRIHIGEINTGSFYLSLLDLINRNYISIKIISKKNKIPEKYVEDNYWKKSNIVPEKILDKIILKINRRSIAKLHPYEKNILRCINALKYQGNINILDTESVIRKRLKVNTFQKNYDAWLENFYNEFIKKNKFKHFNSRISQILGLGGWTKKGKEIKEEWDLFKNHYNKNLKKSNKSEKFLNEGIKYIPYLLAVGIPKKFLINSFSQTTNINDTFKFLKYEPDSLIKSIVQDFLHADSSFDPKYYNTSGNFVQGYG